MKFIPTAVSRKIAEQGLLASENAPKVLFVGGVVGMVGSTILACRATLKVEAVIDRVETGKEQAEQVLAAVNRPDYDGAATYSAQEYKKDLHILKIRGAGEVVKLYAPSVVLGVVSVAALTKSHNILKDRNLALAAAYTAVDSAFTRYRERVVDLFGEEMDHDIRYESETVEIVDEETGEVRTVTRATDAPGSIYARFYDEESSRNWSTNPDINTAFLRTVQNYMNDRLRIRGHVFLNEVYDELGLSHTKPGAIVGWRWNKDSGDDYIDFGIWDSSKEVVSDFFNGREGAILLDFNVDGVIYDKIEERY